MARDETYTYSQLSADSARHFVALHYGLDGPLRGRFYVLGLHDNYLIEHGSVKYILRVYRNDWRTPEEIYFELELLAYLRERNAQVACPVRTAGGELAFSIDSPEGERVAALFHYANGRAPEDTMSADDCALLGSAVSNVHLIADSFTTHRTRRDLDVHYLLDESIEAIKPFIESNELSYLIELNKRLRDAWPAIPREAGVFGICIGDVNARNFHIDGDRRITLFDFDQCGYGFRAFEIGKFGASLYSHRMKPTLMAAFLDGYQQSRRLSRAEYHSIPYFELVAVIWVMAIHAKNANRIGYKLLEKPFWDRKLAILKKLEAQQQDTAPGNN